MALVFPIEISKLIHQGIVDTVVLDSPKAGNYRDWQNEANPKAAHAFFKVYFLNITNPNEILKGAKPILHQVGPYSYREYHVRHGIQWFQDNEILRFKTYHYFVFDPASTGAGLHEDDVITTVNLALFGVHQQLVDMKLFPMAERLLLRFLLQDTVGPTPFHSRKMKELFWGYSNDPVLSFVKAFLPSLSTDFPPLQVNHTSMEDSELNANEDMMYTGKGNLSKTFEFIHYQNQSLLYACTKPMDNSTLCPLYQSEWTRAKALENGWTPVWATDEANRIFGTDGTQFAPDTKAGSQIPIFVDALQRSSYLRNTNEETVRDLYGIEMLRFRLRAEDLTNSSDNAPYYMNGPSGLMNFTSIIGFPLFVSKPHFLDCDYRLLQSVHGLDPVLDLHDTFIDVEPNTGISMRAGKRMMFTALLTSWDMTHKPGEEQWKWTVSSEVDNGLFLPVVWIDSYDEMTEEQAHEFKGMLLAWMKNSKYIRTYGFVGTGVMGALGLVGLFVVWREWKRDQVGKELSESLNVVESDP